MPAQMEPRPHWTSFCISCVFKSPPMGCGERQGFTLHIQKQADASKQNAPQGAAGTGWDMRMCVKTVIITISQKTPLFSINHLFRQHRASSGWRPGFFSHFKRCVVALFWIWGIISQMGHPQSVHLCLYLRFESTLPKWISYGYKWSRMGVVTHPTIFNISVRVI